MVVKLIKENGMGKTFETEKFKILYRIKDSIGGNNTINPEEVIYFITGKAQITLEEKTWNVEAPAKVHFPAKTYHKIKALTDISFIIFES